MSIARNVRTISWERQIKDKLRNRSEKQRSLELLLNTLFKTCYK